MWHKGSLGWQIGIIGRYRKRVTERINKLIGSRFFAGYLILLIPLIHGSTPTSGPVFIADFEEGNISDMPGPQNSRRGKIEVVTTPVRAGRYAVKMYAAPGDKRTELLLRGEQWATNRGYDDWFDESKGTEYYYTFSIYVPVDFPNLRRTAVLAQWHGQNGNSATVALRYDGDTFSIASATQAPQHHDLKTDIPANKNGWNDFVFHVLWERDNKGLLEVWRRNSAGHFVKEFEKFSVNTIDDQNGVYFKWGVYSSSDDKGLNKPRTVYLDNLIIWGPDGRQNALDGVIDNDPPSAPRNLRVSTSS